MNAACKQWWQDHSDELTEWDWDSFRRVWEAAQLSVVAPSASHNSAITPPEERDCDTCAYDGDCYVTVLRCKGYHQAAQ